MPAARRSCLHRVAAAAAAVLVAACAVPPPVPAPPPGVPTAPAVPPGPSLADEHRRLRDALQGTSAALQMTADGRLRLEVPLKHSFDTGRAAVKPSLATVLDRMASALRQQRATELRIAAPSDPGGSSVLAADRAASTRDYLIARGVPAIRFASVARGERDAVEIVVSERFTPPPAR